MDRCHNGNAVAATVNPYESPGEPCDASGAVGVVAEPTALHYWRVYLAFHLLVVIATFIATMLDTGHWRLNIVEGSGLQVLVYSFLMLVYFPGIFLAVWISPIIMLVLFVRAFNLDKRYAVAGLAELILSGAHLLIALPLYQ